MAAPSAIEQDDRVLPATHWAALVGFVMFVGGLVGLALGIVVLYCAMARAPLPRR
jgi:hypothetical protein